MLAHVVVDTLVPFGDAHHWVNDTVHVPVPALSQSGRNSGGYPRGRVESVTQDYFREWMHIRLCKPRCVVADVVLSAPSWLTFWNTRGMKAMPTGMSTSWSNKTETAVRLFKKRYERLLMDATSHPRLSKVTLRDLI